MQRPPLSWKPHECPFIPNYIPPVHNLRYATTDYIRKQRQYIQTKKTELEEQMKELERQEAENIETERASSTDPGSKLELRGKREQLERGFRILARDDKKMIDIERRSIKIAKQSEAGNGQLGAGNEQGEAEDTLLDGSNKQITASEADTHAENERLRKLVVDLKLEVENERLKKEVVELKAQWAMSKSCLGNPALVLENLRAIIKERDATIESLEKAAEESSMKDNDLSWKKEFVKIKAEVDRLKKSGDLPVTTSEVSDDVERGNREIREQNEELKERLSTLATEVEWLKMLNEDLATVKNDMKSKERKNSAEEQRHTSSQKRKPDESHNEHVISYGNSTTGNESGNSIKRSKGHKYPPFAFRSYQALLRRPQLSTAGITYGMPGYGSTVPPPLNPVIPPFWMGQQPVQRSISESLFSKAENPISPPRKIVGPRDPDDNGVGSGDGNMLHKPAHEKVMVTLEKATESGAEYGSWPATDHSNSPDDATRRKAGGRASPSTTKVKVDRHASHDQVCYLSMSTDSEVEENALESPTEPANEDSNAPRVSTAPAKSPAQSSTVKKSAKTSMSKKPTAKARNSPSGVKKSVVKKKSTATPKPTKTATKTPKRSPTKKTETGQIVGQTSSPQRVSRRLQTRKEARE